MQTPNVPFRLPPDRTPLVFGRLPRPRKISIAQARRVVRTYAKRSRWYSLALAVVEAHQARKRSPARR